MEINLSQQLSQKLKITPQLKQALSILCLNNLDLAKAIQDEVDSNPLLEVQEEEKLADAKETISANRETNIVWEYNFGDDDESEPGYYSASSPDSYETVLYDLIDQINFSELDSQDQLAFNIIVKNLNDCGFFNCSLSELAKQNNISEELLLKNLELIKSLDPAGIAAKDLRDCLLIQLNRFHHGQSLARRIVENHLQEVGNKSFSKLAQIYDVDQSKIISAVKLIQSLNPRPVVSLKTDISRFLIPDLKLINNGSRWLVQLNEDSLPSLGISSFYLDLINRGEYNSEQEKKYLTTKYKDAGWLIQAIYQRKNTIKQVAEVIVNKQIKFFTDSDNLNPLKLSDIAKELDIHESTVSRAVQDKFIATPKGIYPLKFFLRNNVKTNGGSYSDQEIKNALANIIESEDTSKPLSDQSIANVLKRAGYQIARRTVSKYRELLGIPSARIRKNQAAIK